MKVPFVQFVRKVNFGAGLLLDALDLRSPQSKARAIVSSIDYNPETGEVVVATTARCWKTGGKPGVLRFGAPSVDHVLEQQVEALKQAEGKKAA